MKERIDRHKDGSIKAKGHMSGSGWMIAIALRPLQDLGLSRSENDPKRTSLLIVANNGRS
jgi:hypothetical protein